MNDHFEAEPKIKYFLFENNYRKFYVGYSNGAIMQYNAGNGSLIKPINEREIEKEGMQIYAYSHTKEISSLYYYYTDEDDYNQHLMLLSASYDSKINIFNEENPEETIKLKTIKGGHTIAGKQNEINCLDFSKILFSYATGRTDGLVIVWDFEISKINDIFYLVSDNKHEKLRTISVKFLDPYPLLAATYSDGTLYIWGVKQSKARGECILRARNYYKHIHKINICPITSMEIFYEDLPEIKNKEIQLYKYFDETSPFMNPNKEYIPKKKRKNENDKNSEEIIDENLNLDIVPNMYKNEIIDKFNDPDLYDDNLNDSENEEHKRKRFYIIIGDSIGNLKVIDIFGLIKNKKFEKSSKVINISSFNLLKKEEINVETILNHDLRPKDEESLPKFTNLYYKMMCYEMRVHLDEIANIRIINEPLSFVTSSKDKYVKIFNFNCECIGVINSLPKITQFDMPKVEWKFKINEEKILEEEINEVVNIFEKEGIEKIKVGSKLDQEVNNIDINEIIKQEEERIKNYNKANIKRKFKYLEKEEKKKDNMNNYDKIDILYEDYFVKEAQRSLERKFATKYENQGINEIMNNLITTTIETQEEQKRKRAKEIEKSLRELEESKINEKKNKNKSLYKKQKSIINSFTSKKTDMNIDLKMTYNPHIKSEKKKEHLILNYLEANNNKPKDISIDNNPINGNLKNSIKRSFTINIRDKRQQNKIENVTPKKRMSIKFLPTIFEKNLENKVDKEKYVENEISKIKNDVENNPKPQIKDISNYSLKNYLKFGKKEKNERPIKLRKEIFDKNFLDTSINKKEQNTKMQNTFFLKHLIKKKDKKKSKNKSFGNRTVKKAFLAKLNHIDLDFPNINDKIIFSKGETEKLLNYQFYKSSYNACCDISKYDSINNKCIKTNYNNNWNYVKQYTYDQGRERKLTIYN